MAGWDPLKYEAVLGMPLREVVLSYEAGLREQARADYQHELLRFAVVSPYLEKKGNRKPPEPPPILRD